MDQHESRREKLRRAVRKAKADALLVTDVTNVTYLTGFTGDDSYLLLRQDGQTMLTDQRYTTQLGEQCPGLDVDARSPSRTMIWAISKALRSAKIGRLGVETHSMSVRLRDQIATERPKMEIVPTAGLIEHLRQIKDKGEVAQLRQAAWYAEKAFTVVQAALRPEKTEKQIADELEYQVRQFGAKSTSFPTIVAVGPRAALPHAEPTDQRMADGEFVLIDWGANGGLYNSDLTRVMATGRISPKFERIYQVVLHAQTQAIAAIRPGATTHDVDSAARNVIAKAGFARYFGHGVGHGLGLKVHEGPRLAANAQGILKAGMVVTVEPGIYLPGWGGIRIEDDVLVNREGHEVLTSLPKRLEDMIVR
jgi:Xaa-Pro aminopeptidase